MSVLTESGKFIRVLDLIRNHPEPGTWWLGLMLLHPDFREKGIGAPLFHALLLWLKERGAKQLSMSVLEPNEAAYRFWKRMGMELQEIRPPAKFGAKVSRALVMTRRLIG